MSDSPYQPPVEPGKFTGDANFAAALFEPLYRRRLWMRIIGVVLIVLGVLYCITILGAIVGVPFIFMGLYLYQAAGHLEGGFQGYAEQLHEGADKLARALQIGGILIAIWAVLMVLYVAFVVVALSVGVFSSVQ